LDSWPTKMPAGALTVMRDAAATADRQQQKRTTAEDFI